MIRVTCRCGASLSVPLALAGQPGRCPSCGATIAVPEIQYASSSVAISPRDLSVRLVKQEALGGSRVVVEYLCAECGTILHAGVNKVGQKRRCEHCFHEATVPSLKKS